MTRQPDVQQKNVVSNCLKTYETPKPNMYIKFRLTGQNEWTKARVLSKQPKFKELEKTKIGLTFFKKEMKSLAVWIGSKLLGKGCMSRKCAASYRPGANESRNCRCKGKGIKEYDRE